MHIPEVIKKELRVIAYGQTVRFRIYKYLVLIPLAAGLYWWKGWVVLGWTLLVVAVVGVTLHFVLRWKTHGWEKPWGPYKPLKDV
jgi:hypothetical protein